MIHALVGYLVTKLKAALRTRPLECELSAHDKAYLEEMRKRYYDQRP